MRMCMVWGKLIAGFCGFLLGGPFGAMLGVLLGHQFDRGLNINNFQFGGQRAETQQAFFQATFLVMGKLAKADGHVSEDEIRMARAVMNSMRLNQQQQEQAIHFFREGKQTHFRLDEALDILLQYAHSNRILLRMFIEIQAKAACADGPPTGAKLNMLNHICQRLGFPPMNFAYQQAGYQQQWQHQGAPRQAQASLQDAFALLEVPESANQAEVKRAYRKQMSQHHPDKLVAKGLPESMLKLATEKTQNIAAAYDTICAAKGWT